MTLTELERAVKSQGIWSVENTSKKVFYETKEFTKGGKPKLACMILRQFTLTHVQAKPGQHTVINITSRGGLIRYTVTNSYGFKQSFGATEFKEYCPKRFGKAVYKFIME